MRNSARLKLNFVLALATAAMLTYWVLQFSSPAVTEEPLLAVTTSDRVARTQPLDTAALAGLFGGNVSARTQTQIKLIGVISQGGEGSGVALLSIRGRPATAFRAGEPIDGNVRLVAVLDGHVLIEQSDGLLEVSLPERALPAGINPAR